MKISGSAHGRVFVMQAQRLQVCTKRHMTLHVVVFVVSGILYMESYQFQTHTYCGSPTLLDVPTVYRYTPDALHYENLPMQYTEIFLRCKN